MAKINWPATGAEVKAAGYKSNRNRDGSLHSLCRDCQAVVYWVTTPNGKKMPLERAGQDRFQSHFSTCPNADQRRRGRGR